MNVREDFPFLKRGIIYFDNAATTQKPLSVINALVDFYKNHNANIHRGIHQLSEEATEMYEESKIKLAKFLGTEWDSVIYTKNATEGLNLAARLISPNSKDKVVVTLMEHHSNLLPWYGSRVEFVGLDEDGQVDMGDFEKKVKGAKVVAVTQASNVLGTITPIEQIIKLAHDEGAVVVVDAAQSVPHMPINFKKMGADFLAFSGHKMLAPTGTGALLVKKELVEDKIPPFPGGDTIEDVTIDNVVWAPLPQRFEGGTPNIAGAIGLGAAVDYLSKIGMETIQKHEASLIDNFFKLSEDLPLKIYGPSDRTGLVSFSFKGVHPHDIADFLNGRKIAIRSGKHCAHPLHTYLNVSATARASFYIYNTLSELNYFFECLYELSDLVR